MNSSNKSKLSIVVLVLAIIFAFKFVGNVSAANETASASGQNEGSQTHGVDAYTSEVTTGNTGNSASRNNYTGTTASWDTGIHQETVTSYNQSFSTPEVRYGSTVFPAMTVTSGDMAIGSKIDIVAVYAERGGYVYENDVRKHVNEGDVIAYIPAGGLQRPDGSWSTAWSILNSSGKYGDVPISEALEYLYQFIDNGDLAAYLRDNPRLTAWGGLKAIEKMSKDEIKKLLCEEGECDTDPKVPIPSCHSGSHAGINEGRTWVINMTKGTGWQQDGTVWARPGDTVRFQIYFCWGSQAVGGSNGDPGKPWAINDKGITQSNSDSFFPQRGGGANVGQTWFQIGSNKGSNYLFGENEQHIGTKKYILTAPHEKTIQAATEGKIKDEYIDYTTADYDFGVYSPSDKSADEGSYNCSIFDFSAFTISKSHGFQIPGATAASCNASNRTGTKTEAGEVITQYISYPEIEAWQQWGHKESGDGCDDCCPYDDDGDRDEDCPLEGDGVRNDLTIENNNVYDDPYESYTESKSAGTWGLHMKYKNDIAKHDYQCVTEDCGIEKWARDYLGCDSGKCSGTIDSTTGDCVNGYWYDENTSGTNECSKANGKAGACETTCNCDGDCEKNCCEAVPSSKYIDPDYNYTTSARYNGDVTKTATVMIPYSYRTATSATIQEGDVIYLGESVYSMFTASIIPRFVKNVRTDEAYATVVPGYIKAVEFIASADSNLSPSTGSSNAGGTDPCSYYSGLMISGCNTIWEEHGEGGMLNGEGRYGGKTYSSGSVKRVVPDTYPVGSKYCVAVGISTSDSHGQPDTQVVSGMSSPSGWRISGLSCRTIAKKPNFQVWNGGFYTRGSIKSSTTVKHVGANLGDSTDPTGYFGSWDEYYVSAKGNVTGFSSGAGLGYYGGYNSNSLGLQGGNSPGTSYCNLSRMTIANDKCDTSTSEYYSDRYATGNSLIEDSASTLLERIRSRYLSSTHGIVSLENGATYIYPTKANIKTSELYQIAHDTLSNTQLSSSVIRQTKGKIDKQSEQTTRNYASNTLVIHVDGTLTIDTDICTGSGDCGSNTNLRLNPRNSSTYTNIYSLPQILIIADGGIVIASNVTQIDAWLITNGNINTCNGLTPSAGGFSADSCGNQLIVNGPIFANSLTPVRNSGANPGAGSGNNINDHSGNPIYYNLTNDGSIQPAEIFNLRPDVLFWAYSQAQRFSQANVTYTRELAPRY